MSRLSRAWRLVVLSGVVVLLAVGFSAWRIATVEATPTGSVTRRLVTWFWKADYWAFPVEGQQALARVHANARRDSREQCVACHDDKTNSRLVLHRIHLRSTLLVNLECHDCHRQVSLAKRGNRAVVTWVDVGFCKKCHSAFPEACPGPRERPDDYKTRCTSCHSGDERPKHAQPYLPKNISGSRCYGCHGGRTLPSTATHARPDWLKVHGRQALQLGADSCYRCHDFGLKFCDQCHGKKPPSHSPAEYWRTIHASAARADTRVCYSCHKTSFCKKCHLHHETGWMQNHPAFVRQKGDSSCAECHSATSCSYCHMQGAPPSSASTAAP